MLSLPSCGGTLSAPTRQGWGFSFKDSLLDELRSASMSCYSRVSDVPPPTTALGRLASSLPADSRFIRVTLRAGQSSFPSCTRTTMSQGEPARRPKPHNPLARPTHGCGSTRIR